jgi:hypothetical protein
MNDCPAGSLLMTDASDGTEDTIPVSGISAVAGRPDEFIGVGAAFGSGRAAIDGDARRRDDRWSCVIVDV